MDAADFYQESNTLAREVRENLRGSDWVLQPDEHRMWVRAELGAGPSGAETLARRLGEITLRHPSLTLPLRIAVYPYDGDSVDALRAALDQEPAAVR